MLSILYLVQQDQQKQLIFKVGLRLSEREDLKSEMNHLMEHQRGWSAGTEVFNIREGLKNFKSW